MYPPPGDTKISKKGDTYSVYERKGTYKWFKKVSYSCGKNEILDTFVYSTDGKMYCVRDYATDTPMPTVTHS